VKFECKRLPKTLFLKRRLPKQCARPDDGHLFTQILENDQIDEIVFYYFGKTEADDAARRFENKTLVLKDVREFWAEMTA